MKILSFDCANKSLAYCLFTIDADKIANNYVPTGKPTPDKVHALIRDNIEHVRDTIVVETCGVVELFIEKVTDTDIIYRTKKLKGALDRMDIGDRNAIDAVVIEYQYVAGSHSREVSDCLCMYFASMNTALFFPSSRKKLHFTDELAYSIFKDKYAKTYSANKAHSVANFKYFIETMALEVFQQCLEQLLATNHDDLADCFLNAWVWLVKAVIVEKMLLLYTARMEAAKAERERIKAERAEARAERIKARTARAKAALRTKVRK